MDGRPVEKRSSNKQSHGGRKSALRRYKSTGTATEEVIYRVSGERPETEPGDRPLPVPLMRGGERVASTATLAQSREHLRAAMVSLPWEGLKLSSGEPALAVTVLR